MVGGQVHHDAAAHRVADQVHRAEAEVVQQRHEIVAKVTQPAGRVDRGGSAPAERAQVRRDTAQTRREHAELLPPGGSVGQVAVHEQHGYPFAAFPSVHRSPLDGVGRSRQINPVDHLSDRAERVKLWSSW
jgi:hypothetical protein